MMSPFLVVLLTVACVLVLCLLFVLVAGGGDLSRIRLALRTEWRTLRDPEFRLKLHELLFPPPPEPPKPVKPSSAPVRFLALLQREGRLIDFLLEDIQAYPDAQIGAAVRDIHRQCRAALREHLVLDPILPQPEGSSVEVTSGFDPSAIRLIGNVTGQPPFRGTLQHHGWRVKEIKLPTPPEGQDELVLMPAEVELP
jgi:hypothetical protein